MDSVATDIIVTGSGSGELTASLWSNYIFLRNPKANVKLISDSAIFLDSANAMSKRYVFR